MEPLKTPELPHIVTDSIVNIPSEQFRKFIHYVNQMAECINIQSSTIVELNNRLKTCEENTAKIAKILEELYET